MAHVKTEAIEILSDRRDGAYLNIYNAELPGVGVWHVEDLHPQFVHLSRGVASYLVFDNQDAARAWIDANLGVDDRLYAVRDGALVDVTDQMLDDLVAKHERDAYNAMRASVLAGLAS
jgi:hypothetical protein